MEKNAKQILEQINNDTVEFRNKSLKLLANLKKRNKFVYFLQCSLVLTITHILIFLCGTQYNLNFEIALERKSEQVRIGQATKDDNLYFDIEVADIPDAQTELNKLIDEAGGE